MKPEIQQRMNERIDDIRSQNTIFDDAISIVETQFDEPMTMETSTRYTLTTETYRIAVTLDESLENGVTTIAINEIIPGGEARIATMTINSVGVIQESYNNIDTKLHRDDVITLFSAIFEGVRSTDDET